MSLFLALSLFLAADGRRTNVKAGKGNDTISLTRLAGDKLLFIDADDGNDSDGEDRERGHRHRLYRRGGA